jgi:transposase-like protein
MKDYEDDGLWMWVAFAPSCRLIVDFIIGPRKQYVADALLEKVSERLSESIPLFVTDSLKFYAEAILKIYGELMEFPRTGKKGRPKKPKLVPVKDLIYAQVIKNREKGRRLRRK